MNVFYTEKKIEECLMDETRVLTLPNGEKEVVTTSRLTWEQFDLMQETKAWSNEDLIRMSYSWYKREQKYDFTMYFWNLVAFAFSEVKKQRYGQ